MYRKGSKSNICLLETYILTEETKCLGRWKLVKYHRKGRMKKENDNSPSTWVIYLGRVSPSSGHTKEIAILLLDFLDTSGVHTSKFVTVGCLYSEDERSLGLVGKNLNIEVQYLVCLMHADELPVRHLMRVLECVTTGSDSFVDSIGSKLVECDKLLIVAFQLIH